VTLLLDAVYKLTIIIIITFAINLEQVANYCVLRSTQPPTLSGMGNE